MRTLLDFLPILLFFGAYKAYDIYLATGVLMAATALQMSLVYAMDRKLQTIHKVTLALVLLFGALTLLLQDDRFIKWKPTVLYLGIALALGVAAYRANKNFLKIMLGTQLQLPDEVWGRLNTAWVVYALFMATANAYVALYFSTEAWVNFKLWGYAFPVIFILGQGVYISRHLGDESAPRPAEPESH
jgi:intracellular septation protein